jgi:hypothetical protein
LAGFPEEGLFGWDFYWGCVISGGYQTKIHRACKHRHKRPANTNEGRPDQAEFDHGKFGIISQKRVGQIERKMIGRPARSDTTIPKSQSARIDDPCVHTRSQ